MISSIGAQGVTPGASQSLGALDSDAFLQLMVAQMRYQNPLSPTDPSQMMAQTAQFTTVETLQKVAETQRQLLGLEWAQIGAQLVGKEVSAVGPDGAAVSGKVDAFRISDQGPLLAIGDVEVPVDSVTEVFAHAAPPVSAPPVTA